MNEDRHMTATTETETRTGSGTALAADSREWAGVRDATLAGRIREAVTFATHRSDVNLLFVEETCRFTTETPRSQRESLLCVLRASVVRDSVCG